MIILISLINTHHCLSLQTFSCNEFLSELNFRVYNSRHNLWTFLGSFLELDHLSGTLPIPFPLPQFLLGVCPPVAHTWTQPLLHSAVALAPVLLRLYITLCYLFICMHFISCFEWYRILVSKINAATLLPSIWRFCFFIYLIAMLTGYYY